MRVQWTLSLLTDMRPDRMHSFRPVPWENAKIRLNSVNTYLRKQHHAVTTNNSLSDRKNCKNTHQNDDVVVSVHVIVCAMCSAEIGSGESQTRKKSSSHRFVAQPKKQTQCPESQQQVRT